MFKRSLFLGILSGLFAGIASLVYQKVYASSLGEDFASIANPSAIIAISLFASILAPFAMKLPFDIETPELFPGLIVPMHFFPALAWFTLKPLFIRSEKA